MAYKIKALSGPLRGQEFELKEGLKFGRTKGEILLDDGKVSSLHAFVAKGDGGDLLLTDNGSKNGIRVGAEKRVSLVLTLGVKFHIGNSEFEVVDQPSRETAANKARVETTASASAAETIKGPTLNLNISEPPEPKDTPPKTPTAQAAPAAPTAKATEDEAAPGGRKWNDLLSEFAAELIDSITDQPRAVVPFNPALKFTFIGGLQAETEWTIGYGPRRVGAHSVDLPILEPSAPDVCFELVPSPEGVTFRTNHPRNVRLNGAEAKMQLLKSGDVIGIGATQIEIEFLK